ncbi:hypothetical protein [Lysobacter gummosus]|uniref:hypothetical protein n=1 Tax=Lysobacter gummosus TaxID=262324 RepID=UPI003644B94C
MCRRFRRWLRWRRCGCCRSLRGQERIPHAPIRYLKRSARRASAPFPKGARFACFGPSDETFHPERIVPPFEKG